MITLSEIEVAKRYASELVKSGRAIDGMILAEAIRLAQDAQAPPAQTGAAAPPAAPPAAAPQQPAPQGSAAPATVPPAGGVDYASMSPQVAKWNTYFNSWIFEANQDISSLDQQFPNGGKDAFTDKIDDVMNRTKSQVAMWTRFLKSRMFLGGLKAYIQQQQGQGQPFKDWRSAANAYAGTPEALNMFNRFSAVGQPKGNPMGGAPLAGFPMQ
jgi:hypothetical protein